MESPSSGLKLPRINLPVIDDNIQNNQKNINNNFDKETDLEYYENCLDDNNFSSNQTDMQNKISKQLEKNRDKSSNDLFLTDKIKEPLTSTRSNPTYTSSQVQTVPLSNLIINLHETPTTVPKPINPMFFITNSEKPVSKNLNFKLNPGLIKTNDNDKEIFSNDNYVSNKGYMTQHEKFLDKISERNLCNKQHHDAFKTFYFDTLCFNKTTNDKHKSLTDIKTIIFNNKNEHYEDKCKMIKNMTKNEMINRSIGRGMFLFHNNFRNEQKTIMALKNGIHLRETNDQEEMKINLKKTNFFDKKKSDRPLNVFFSRTFLKMTYEDYKKIQKQRMLKQLKEKEINWKYNNMYNKVGNGIKRKEDLKAIEKINTKEIKTESKINVCEKKNYENKKPLTHIDTFNQILDLRLEEMLHRANSQEFIRKNK